MPYSPLPPRSGYSSWTITRRTGRAPLADEIAARDPRVQVLHRPGKQGLGAAYRAAFLHLLQNLAPDVIVQMDCDFSHDPADVPRLLAAIRVRCGPGDRKPLRQRGIDPRLGHRPQARQSGREHALPGTVLRLPVHDLTGGFKAWRGSLLRSLELDRVETQGYGFQVEMTWRAHQLGARIRELPIVFSERRAGQSKMSRRIIVEALLMVMRLRLRGRAVRSAGLRASQAVDGLVGGAGGIAIDDLLPVPIVTADGPPGGGLAANGAGKADAGESPRRCGLASRAASRRTSPITLLHGIALYPIAGYCLQSTERAVRP